LSQLQTNTLLITNSMPITWINQIGENAYAEAYSVASASDGSIYIVGRSSGSFGGAPFGGFYDGFIQKRASDGSVIWTKFSNEGQVAFNYTTVIASSTSVYGAGLAKLDIWDVAGNSQASIAIPAVNGRSFFPYSSTLFQDAVYLAGYLDYTSSGPFGIDSAVLKLDAVTGTLQQSIVFGQSGAHDWVESIKIQANGNLVVCGRTNAPSQSSAFSVTNINQPQGGDCFVATFDTNGNVLWRQEFGGTAQDWAHGLAIGTDGAIYVVGRTDAIYGNQSNTGGEDAYLVKFSSSGQFQWVRQFGCDAADAVTSVAVDSSGNIAIGGYSYGAIFGLTPQGGGPDGFIAKFDPSGNRLSAALIGSSADDQVNSVTTIQEDVIAVGWTGGNVQTGASIGARDAFIGRFAGDLSGNQFVASYSLAADASHVSEGTTIGFTVQTNAPQGTPISWQVSGVSASDLGGGLTGATSVGINGSARFSINVVADSLTEGNESMTVSVNGQQVSVSITDTSTSSIPICFARGTLIHTANQATSVESLTIGSKVQNKSGGIAKCRWIGYQRRTPEFAQFQDYLPVKISAGALDDNLPLRDLYLSPDHAVLVDSHLIHAKALINGKTIVQMTEWEGDIEYYHIETEAHEIIYAEGVPCETFIDNVSREQFDNYAEYQALYPNTRMMKELPLPRVKFKRQLPLAIRQRLESRISKLDRQKKG
jgi:hypothetical protein